MAKKTGKPATTGAADALSDRLSTTIDHHLDRLRVLTAKLDRALSAPPAERLETQPRLEFAEVVTFLVQNKDKVTGAVGGAVRREALGSVYRVRLFYLDADGEPMLSPGVPRWALMTREFDDELTTAFGPHDLIIFS